MSILGIIPARAGSKGIKDKNVYELCGKPLIQYTIEECICSLVDDYIISTDDEHILLWYKKAYKRPSYLSGDDTPMIELLQYLLKHRDTPKCDAICLLQPTSPLRTAEDINKAIELFKSSSASSLYSGYYIGIKNKDKVYDKHTCKPHFQRNGAIFISSVDLIRKGMLWNPNDVVKFEMPFSRSIDVDTYEDLFLCESILRNKDSLLNQNYV